MTMYIWYHLRVLTETKKWLKPANFPKILQTKYCPKVTGICLKWKDKN